MKFILDKQKLQVALVWLDAALVELEGPTNNRVLESEALEEAKG